ncbi:MAG: glycoside hydrolase [Kitasatospora sp.]|nr:glycoside hydrolase [Kitasatospora sp.]
MKTRLLLALAAVLAIGLVVAPSTLRAPRAGAAVHGLSLQGLNKIQHRILSGFASYEAGIGVPKATARVRTRAPMRAGATSSALCPGNFGSNVLVNQNCLNVSDSDLQGRGQAQNETAISQNPFNHSQVVASFNDYRRGDATCGAAFSRNGGSSWTDATMPTNFTRGTAFGNVARQYWQGGGDPSVAWDTRGNAYYACQVFQRGPSTTNNPDQSSAIYVFRSTGDGGASTVFPGRPAVETFTTSASGLPFNDKPYMTVDNSVTSPFRDRIYLTWTLFAPNGTAYIFEVHSNDYGETFSSPVLVSTTSSLCASPGVPTPHGTCNENQFSNPFTGPDGTLYVAYDNFNTTNTGKDNHFQVLLTRSTNGGQSFSAPVKVGNYYDLPDCATYQGGQDAGVLCVPEKGAAQNSVFRATNYPSGGVNPNKPRQVVVTFGSYINRNSDETNGCVPQGFSSTTGGNLYAGVKKAGACSNKILISESDNGARTFTGTTTDPRKMPVVTTAPRQVHTDQWWQWAAFTPRAALAVSYYDRQYGTDETSGDMDMSLSTSATLHNFTVRRVTSSSMPLPTQFNDSQGNGTFFGDYSGLTAVAGAHPLWMDTRNLELFTCPGTAQPGVPPSLCAGAEPNGIVANDQEAYTRTLTTP